MFTLLPIASHLEARVLGSFDDSVIIQWFVPVV